MGAGWTRWWDNGVVTWALRPGPYNRRPPLIVVVQRFEVPPAEVFDKSTVGSQIMYHGSNDDYRWLGAMYGLGQASPRQRVSYSDVFVEEFGRAVAQVSAARVEEDRQDRARARAAGKPLGEYVWCAVCGHFIQFVHAGRPRTMGCPNRCTVTVQMPKLAGVIRNLTSGE